MVTGVNQTAAKLQMERANEAGWEFFEVTAHEGARPTHAVWQGKVYHKGGRVTVDGVVYEDFVKSTGYGTGAGLCGWNCRHSFSPYWPELSERTWSDEALAQLDAKSIEYDGKQYSEYEISQMQRGLERKVRYAKRQYLAQTAAGQDAATEAVQLKPARQNLKAFANATQQSTSDSVRTYVPGFGRSEASKATWAAKKNTLTNAAGQQIIVVKKAKTTATPNSITQKVNAKGGIDRNYYGSDGRQTKQISNNGHGRKKEEVLGKHGEHAHDYTWDADGTMHRSEGRELKPEEREENRDIL